MNDLDFLSVFACASRTWYCYYSPRTKKTRSCYSVQYYACLSTELSWSTLIKHDRRAGLPVSKKLGIVPDMRISLDFWSTNAEGVRHCADLHLLLTDLLWLQWGGFGLVKFLHQNQLKIPFTIWMFESEIGMKLCILGISQLHLFQQDGCELWQLLCFSARYRLPEPLWRHVIYCFGHHGFHVEEFGMFARCHRLVHSGTTRKNNTKRSEPPNDNGDSWPEFRFMVLVNILSIDISIDISFNDMICHCLPRFNTAR